MHRIDGPGATDDNLFTEGDPVIGMQATTVTANWLNAIQEEIANAIEASGIDLDKDDNHQLTAAIRALAVDPTPVGVVLEWPFSAAPDGYLLCHGQPLSPGEHDNLRQLLIDDGYRWGVDVNGNPRVPDRRAMFARGVDSGRGIDPGRELGSQQKGSLVVGNTSTDSIKGVVLSDAHEAAGYDVPSLDDYPSAEMIWTNPLAVNIRGGAVSDEDSGITRPVNVAINYIIKV